MTQIPEQNDLTWQAFLYAAGELNSQDAATFEAHLATSRQAQEALVEAMQMTTLLQATIAQSAAQPVMLASESQRSYSDSRSAMQWAIVGSSLLSVVLLVAAYFGSGTGAVTTGHKAELAEVWSEQLSVDMLDTQESMGEETLDSDLAASENDFPSWMLEAIRVTETNELPENETAEEMES